MSNSEYGSFLSVKHRTKRTKRLTHKCSPPNVIQAGHCTVGLAVQIPSQKTTNNHEYNQHPPTPISRTVQHGSTRSTQCCKCAWCVPARGGFDATLLAAACHECRPVLWSRGRPTTPVKTTKDWVSCRVTIVASAPTKLPPNERRGLVGAERWCTTQR